MYDCQNLLIKSMARSLGHVLLSALGALMIVNPLYCSTGACNDGAVRYVSYNTDSFLVTQGIFKVCMYGTWHYACDEGWNQADAAVICRSLGYETYGALIKFNQEIDSKLPQMPKLRMVVGCHGNELDLSECGITVNDHDSSGSHISDVYEDDEDFYGSGDPHAQCSDSNIAGIMCHGIAVNGSCADGSIKLVGDGGYVGKIKICINNVWTSVCSNDWDEMDATVACKQLGFSQPDSVSSVLNSAEGILEIPFITNVHCSGSENNLLECSHELISTLLCKEAGVVCYASCREGDIKLLPSTGDEIRGIVLLCKNGQWGVFCGQFWTELEASITCQQLGYSYKGAAALFLPLHDETAYTYHSVSTNCTVSDTNLEQCLVSTSSNRCNSLHLFPSVQCQVGCTHGEIDIQKTNISPDTSMVIPKICINSSWKTVCDWNWSYSDATVACRNSGASSFGALPVKQRSIKYGDSLGLSSPIIANFSCTGNEESLEQCTTNFTSTETCSEKVVSAAICQRKNLEPDECTTGDTKLEKIIHSRPVGNVKICVNRKWGDLCYDNAIHDVKLGRVLCNELGYYAKNPVIISPAIHTDNVVYRITTECIGNESRFIDCDSKPLTEVFSLLHCQASLLHCPEMPPLIVYINSSQSHFVLDNETAEGKIELLCEAVGTPVIDINWYFSDGKGAVTTLDSHTTRQGYNVTSSLTIDGISVRSNGNYTCSATNHKGTSHSTITLRINVTPKIDFKVSSYPAIHGSSLYITCTALGYPAPKLFLQKESSNILKNCTAEILSNGLYSTQCQIYTNSSTLKDAGTYMCIAKKQEDIEAQYQSLYVDIWLHPVITIAPLDVVVHENSGTVSLECEVVASPTPYIIWTKGNHILSQSHNYQIGTAVTNITTTSSKLTLHEASGSSGYYQCIGVNSLGTVSGVAAVVVYAIPTIHFSANTSLLVVPNTTITLTCRIDNLNKLIARTDIKWIRGNYTVPLNQSLDFESETKTYEYNLTSVLEIKKPSGSATYKCQFTYNHTKYESMEVRVEDPLTVKLIQNSPSVQQGNITIVLSVNKPVQSITCQIGDDIMDCSSGEATFKLHCHDPVHPVEVIINATSNIGEQLHLTRTLFIDSPSTCSVHLINDGVTINGSNMLVEFAKVGPVHSCVCLMDNNKSKQCNSPMLFSDLEPGKHKIIIKPKCHNRHHIPLAYSTVIDKTNNY